MAAAVGMVWSMGQHVGDQLVQLVEDGELGQLEREKLVQLRVGQLLEEIRVVGVQLEQLMLQEELAGVKQPWLYLWPCEQGSCTLVGSEDGQIEEVDGRLLEDQA